MFSFIHETRADIPLQDRDCEPVCSLSMFQHTFSWWSVIYNWQKQKVGQDLGEKSEDPDTQLAPKVVRQFLQKQPVVEATKEAKSRLSREVLAGVSITLLLTVVIKNSFSIYPVNPSFFFIQVFGAS